MTAPALETKGNGMDVLTTSNTHGSSGQQLVSQLQMAGHVMLGFSALQVTSAPMSSLLLLKIYQTKTNRAATPPTEG